VKENGCQIDMFLIQGYKEQVDIYSIAMM
jgi:hypothetical protein